MTVKYSVNPKSEIVKSPLRYLKVPELLHIELTTRCPLRCSQCYCDLTTGKDIDKKILFSYLEEAAEIGVRNIALSGGEPLVYPYLTEVIAYIHKLGMHSVMATSGYGLDEKRVKELEKADIGEIYISLNGSTKEIHNKSRDAFEESLRALELLQNTNIKYSINWVARRDNILDFKNVIKLGKKYGVSCIAILVLKPDSKYELDNYLKDEEFFEFAKFLRGYNNSDLPIYVEACYSNLRAYLIGSKNMDMMMGCTAGRRLMAINVEGMLTPCRHLFNPEKYNSIKDYWNNSEILQKLRTVEENIKEPCRNCKYVKNCLSCRATSIKLHGDLYAGDHQCPVSRKKEVKGDKLMIDISKVKWLQS